MGLSLTGPGIASPRGLAGRVSLRWAPPPGCAGTEGQDERADAPGQLPKPETRGPPCGNGGTPQSYPLTSSAS
eukprot:11167539-Lingulodinium_polyedra.AAC.1